MDFIPAVVGIKNIASSDSHMRSDRRYNHAAPIIGTGTDCIGLGRGFFTNCLEH